MKSSERKPSLSAANTRAAEPVAGLQEELNEKNILFSLSKQIAQVRAKADLMQLIKDKFSQLFYFYHCTICILEEDKKSYRAFLLDPNSKIKVHSKYKHLVSNTYPVNNGIDDVTLASPLPVIFDFDTIVSKGQMPPQGMIIYEAGIREMVGAALELEKERFGFIVFYSDVKSNFTPKHIPLIETIASLIAPVVSNIIATEKVEKKIKERDALLMISDAIASVKDRHDFLEVINNKLKQLFAFTHSIVLKFSDDHQTLFTFLLDPNSKSKQHVDYQDIVSSHLSAEDSLIRTLLEAKGPVVFDIEQEADKPGAHPYLKMNYRTGLEEFAGVVLRQADQQPLGVLYFYADEKGTFSDDILRLIHGLSYHLSTAIINILHHEEILQHDRENEILLELSNEVVGIKEKPDLIRVISKSLKKFFKYDDCHIVLYNKTRRTYRTYIYHAQDKHVNNPVFQSLVNLDIPEEDTIIDYSHLPVIIDVETLAKAGIDFGLKIYEMGIREFIRVKLTDASEVVGLLILLSDEKTTFSQYSAGLLQKISFQLSKAISGLLAREEILRRDNENKALLSLSVAIASIRDKRDLLKVVNHELKSILRFTDLSISVYDEFRETYQVFLQDCPTMGLHSDYETMPTAKDHLQDGLQQLALSSESPIFLTEENLRAMDEPSVQFMLGAGIKELAVIRLQQGNQVIGVMVLMSSLSNVLIQGAQSLIQRVSHHIATSVSNIIANEEIDHKDQEKSMLLAFSKDIAGVTAKKELEEVIWHHFVNHFQIQNYIITARNSDEQTHSYYLFDRSGDYENLAGFDEIKAAKWPVESKLFDLSYIAYAPIIFDSDLLLKQGVITESYANFWKIAGLERWMGVPLRVGNEDIGVFWTLPGAVNEPLLNEISSQVGFAINSILANDKITQQLAEISHFKEKLEEENYYLQAEVQSGFSYSDIIGSGTEMQKVFQLLTQVSFANSTVLILGETGTGKELIARAIHNSSPRKDKLMVKVNCAALPANLIESELFGHEKGSFTGATERRIGKFELASQGTLFLDEIGEMPVDLQVKLLRAIQEKEIERVGGRGTIKVDVRIIAATNRNLEKGVEEGKFRSDLFYRLNVFPITLPPLRNRKEDIPVLAAHFLHKYVKNTGKKISSISIKAMEELMAYDWPGNVRELEHLMERSILMTSGNTVKEMHLPVSRKEFNVQDGEGDRIKTFEENERDYIIKVLAKCNGKIFGRGGAAELLEINVGTLNSKIKKLGIQKGMVFMKKP